MTIIELWLPIVVSAAAMFVASFVIWAVLKYHNSDYSRTGDEEAVRAALKGSSPGFYLVPYCTDPGDMKDPELAKKFADGPVAYVTVARGGMPKMGPSMIQMVLYFLFIGVLCAYVVSRTLPPDADYLSVFRIAGTVAFIANGIAIIPESIWFARPWKMTVKNIVDAVIYSLLAGGIFGWLV